MKLLDKESDVLAGCLELLRLRRFPAWRTNSGIIRTESRSGIRKVMLAPAGTSDILGIVPVSGRMLAVEAKRAQGGKLSDAQRTFLDTVRRNGGVALVVADLRWLDYVLGELIRDPDAVFSLEGPR